MLQEVQASIKYLKLTTRHNKHTWAKPGAAQQTPLSFIDSLSKYVILFLSQLYGAAKHKQFKMVLPIIK